MLPTVVIGADDTVRAALDAFASENADAPLAHYPDAETAHAALVDLLGTDRPFARQAVRDEDQAVLGWEANVAYGPNALGPAVTAQANATLDHTGWTLVLAYGFDRAPVAPIRTHSGQPTSSPPDTLVFQALGKLQAQVLVDVGEPASLPAVFGQLARTPKP